jgi:hypothetical protein
LRIEKVLTESSAAEAGSFWKVNVGAGSSDPVEEKKEEERRRRRTEKEEKEGRERRKRKKEEGREEPTHPLRKRSAKDGAPSSFWIWIKWITASMVVSRW